MTPELPAKSGSDDRSSSQRLVRRGVIIYLAAAILVTGICYVFGWRALASYGTGFLYGAVVLVILGFFMATGPILPVWRPKAGKKAPSSSQQPGDTLTDRRSDEAGALFFRAALVGGALLGLTGILIKCL